MQGGGKIYRSGRRGAARRLLALAAALALVGTLHAAPPALTFEPAPGEAVGPPPAFTLESAIAWALQNNPELAAFRQQRGIAAAAVVIAQTYPFNPTSENRIQAASGPASAGITNRVPLEHLLLQEVELRHQGRYRRQAAGAALSRAEWEIAAQEQALAVRVMEAFQTLVYRRDKLTLLEEILSVNRQLVEDVRLLQKSGQASPADLIVADTEVQDTLAQIRGARGTLVTAQTGLVRALGLVGGPVRVEGTLEVAFPPLDPAALTPVALARRADLRARELAVQEAAARTRLEVANRFGNPVVGPAFGYDPTQVASIGAQINIPLPVWNRHKGDILQREAEEGRAVLEVRQAEVAVRQDVQAAVVRLRAAAAVVDLYREQILPSLRQAEQQVTQLFRAAQGGVDILRIVDVRRKLIRARDSYLDALLELNLARTALAAALGEPAAGPVDGCPPPTPHP